MAHSTRRGGTAARKTEQILRDETLTALITQEARMQNRLRGAAMLLCMMVGGAGAWTFIQGVASPGGTIDIFGQSLSTESGALIAMLLAVVGAVMVVRLSRISVTADPSGQTFRYNADSQALSRAEQKYREIERGFADIEGE
jgi:hypothetical protein